jgi:hypothetical protein
MDSGDETHPVCKACSKKNRPCQWDSPASKFKVYQPPLDASDKSDPHENDADSDAMDVYEGSDEGQASSRTFFPNTNQSISRRNSRADGVPETSPSCSGTSQHSPDNESLALCESRRSSDESNRSSATALNTSQVPQGTRPYSQIPIPLTHDEAVLVHHYTEHLGRWLDCTDATRQFTLGVPGKVKQCPVLCYAVLSFAARHRREEATADAAYNRCIALLIDRLNEDAASHDETLLCAIVILCFYEQLSGGSTPFLWYHCADCR